MFGCSFDLNKLCSDIYNLSSNWRMRLRSTIVLNHQLRPHGEQQQHNPFHGLSRLINAHFHNGFLISFLSLALRHSDGFSKCSPSITAGKAYSTYDDMIVEPFFCDPELDKWKRMNGSIVIFWG